jgi:PPM family protein phosphatase
MLRVVEEAARTDTGRQRRNNEDAYFARAPAYAVADGMGGAQAGEVAARIATETFEEGLDDARAPAERLSRVAAEANRRIFHHAQEDRSRSGMGTTLTAALVDGEEVTIVHVGDSRAYLLRDGELRQLTRDHSLVEELRRQGQLSTEEAEEHPQRSIITRALGAEPEVELDVQTHQAKTGDVFLLCSDGLTTMVRDERLHDILADSRSLEQAADALVREANARGGRDNVTAILFRVAAEGEEAARSDRVELEETRTDLSAAQVEAALTAQSAASAEAPEQSSGAVATAERRTPSAPLDGSAPSQSEAAERPARRRSRRRVLRAALALLVLAALVTGGFFGARAGLRGVYFIGEDDRGLVTLYQGVPYELPAGIELYDTKYVSPVQAARLRPFERRRLFDHELRSRKDAADLIRNLERNR